MIRDMNGVFCPMGCGQTLHLTSAGMIMCTDPRCRDKGAAQKILADPETEHIGSVRGGTVSVRHPLRERLDDMLFSCGACEVLLDVAEDGTYRITDASGSAAGTVHITSGGTFLVEALETRGQGTAAPARLFFLPLGKPGSLELDPSFLSGCGIPEEKMRRDAAQLPGGIRAALACVGDAPYTSRGQIPYGAVVAIWEES